MQAQTLRGNNLLYNETHGNVTFLCLHAVDDSWEIIDRSSCSFLAIKNHRPAFGTHGALWPLPDGEPMALFGPAGAEWWWQQLLPCSCCPTLCFVGVSSSFFTCVEETGAVREKKIKGRSFQSLVSSHLHERCVCRLFCPRKNVVDVNSCV